MNLKVLFLSSFLITFGFIASIAQDFNSIKNDADLAFMDGNYQKALDIYKGIMNVEKADSTEIALIYSNAGMCCTQLNQNSNAINYFKVAVKYNVPQLMVYDQLISLSKQEKDYETYEFALLQKQLAFPDFAIEVKQKLAFHYFNTRQYEKLLPLTTELIEWYPDYAKNYLFNAVAKQNLNDIAGAETSYDKALELDPNHAGANMGKGMILYNKASAMYDKMKNKYEALDKPSRVDYSNYRKQIEEPKTIFAEALPYLLNAYKNKSYSSLKGTIKNTYLKLEDVGNANKY